MGCDIHEYIEVKKYGKWEFYNWEKDCESGEYYEDGTSRKNYDKLFEHPLYIGRNYNLFSVLANVRNGRGFAGVPTGSGFEPISNPRGLPQDISKEVFSENEQWCGDGHSHSYLTLQELLDYDYEGKTTTQYGVVGLEEYKQFKENGKPNSWCGGVSGGKVEKVSNYEMDKFLENGLPNDDLHYYTSVSWNESYLDAIGHYWLDYLEELKKLGNQEDVRLVFWFDN